MTDSLIKLYDTFLARFSFFRAHIRVLMEMNERLLALEESNELLRDQLLSMEEKYAGLLDRCGELEQALELKPEKTETSRGLIRTSQDIMQSIYSNYYATGEALPDRQ